MVSGTCIYICMYIHMSMYVYMYVYTHTYVHTCEYLFLTKFQAKEEVGGAAGACLRGGLAASALLVQLRCRAISAAAGIGSF